MASSCVVFRLAKSLQEAAEAAKPERESCLVRAGRIAAHYWDDPAKWAAQDPHGKGVLTCLREVDSTYPRGLRAHLTHLQWHWTLGPLVELRWIL